MKQTTSFSRRTGLAIAAASAGLTLAITATIASSLGLIAPASPVAAPSTDREQPIQQPVATVVSDALASVPAAAANQPSTSEVMRPSARGEDGRSARREHDDDDRGERLRRSSPSDAAAGRSTGRVVSRARHEEDHDD